MNIRIVPHRGDDSRYDSSPPRAWQTGDRRSPPSEASESRRRTRPRHSSFRGTASNTATAGSSRHSSSHAGSSSSMTSLQQNPARERVNPPTLSCTSPPHIHHSLTPLSSMQYPSQRPYYHPGHNLSRFSMPPMPSMPPYQSPESLGMNPPHPMPPHAAAFGSMGNLDGTSISHPYQPPILGGPSGASLSTGGDPLPGPAQLDAYSQQLPSSASLPPVVATEDAPFGATTNPGPNPGVMRFTRPDGMVYMMQ